MSKCVTCEKAYELSRLYDQLYGFRDPTYRLCVLDPGPSCESKMDKIVESMKEKVKNNG